MARAREGPKPAAEPALEEREAPGEGEEPPDAAKASWKSEPSVVGPGSFG